MARQQDSKAQAGAYELLAKIALKRKDRVAAERYAVLAQEANPSLPMPIYVQGLIRHAEVATPRHSRISKRRSGSRLPARSR